MAGAHTSCVFQAAAVSSGVEWVCGGGMAKLADALDLKSNGPKGPCGFNSHSRYQRDFLRDKNGHNTAKRDNG